MSYQDLESENARLRKALEEILEITNDVYGSVKKLDPKFSTTESAHPFAIGMIRNKVRCGLKMEDDY